jgi:hypothetical protein
MLKAKAQSDQRGRQKDLHGSRRMPLLGSIRLSSSNIPLLASLQACAHSHRVKRRSMFPVPLAAELYLSIGHCDACAPT